MRVRFSKGICQPWLGCHNRGSQDHSGAPSCVSAGGWRTDDLLVLTSVLEDHGWRVEGSWESRCEGRDGDESPRPLVAVILVTKMSPF